MGARATITGFGVYLDGSDTNLITNFDPNVTVYGINCDSALDEFDNAMENNGYQVSRDSDISHSAEFGKVSIWIVYTDEQNTLHISVELTNKSGIDF